jgi:hypothetical protein
MTLCSLRESKKSRSISGQPRDTVSVENECVQTWHFRMQTLFVFVYSGQVALWHTSFYYIFHIINTACFGCQNMFPPPQLTPLTLPQAAPTIITSSLGCPEMLPLHPSGYTNCRNIVFGIYNSVSGLLRDAITPAIQYSDLTNTCYAVVILEMSILSCAPNSFTSLFVRHLYQLWS